MSGPVISLEADPEIAARPSDNLAYNTFAQANVEIHSGENYRGLCQKFAGLGYVSWDLDKNHVLDLAQ